MRVVEDISSQISRTLQVKQPMVSAKQEKDSLGRSPEAGVVMPGKKNQDVMCVSSSTSHSPSKLDVPVSLND